ncbi:MAG TPA: protealysin inhibitor emfourin [Anaerolineales bacterium]|nr:protealysin inhibitor emfourin [Anaerolineales bacterium]
MRVDFQGSGGFANLKLTCHVDTDTLPQAQAEELLKLVQSSGVFDLQQSDVRPAPSGGPPDVFSYQLSVSAGDRQKTLTFNDVTAPGSLQPLLAWLRTRALEQKQRGA